MARISAKKRKSLPDSAFAGGIDETKGKGDAKRRRFPIDTTGRARSALRLLGKAKGLSSGEKANIRARANAKLGKKRGLRNMNDG